MKRIVFISVMVLLMSASCNSHNREVAADEAAPDAFIKLSDAQVQLANINATEAREGMIGRKRSFTGVLKTIPANEVAISARLNGRIEKLYFRNTGDIVRKGDSLYEFYSDEMADAQREYLNLQSSNWNFTGRYEPSLVLKDKLLVMGFTPSQVTQLEKDRKILFRVTILSPADGAIKAVNVTEGQYVQQGDPLFGLTGNDQLWIEALVYQDEIKAFRPGMKAFAVVPSAGDAPVLCNITSVNPSVEPGTEITVVRASLDNNEKRLKAGMLALLHVSTSVTHGIIIPSSAVITGSAGDRVWIQDENNGFFPRIVTTGVESYDSVQVLSGIRKSDKVVYSGAYLLDSEYILRNGAASPGNEALPDFKLGQAH